jgi:hypothetical protein
MTWGAPNIAAAVGWSPAVMQAPLAARRQVVTRRGRHYIAGSIIGSNSWRWHERFVHLDDPRPGGRPQTRVAQAQDAADAEARARAFVAEHEERIRPLEIATSLAWWKANTTGDDADFAAKEAAQNKLDEALSDEERFAELKALREVTLSDPTVEREIEVLYLGYVEKQVPTELLQKITSRANAIEKAFNVFRAKVGERELTDSEVKKTFEATKAEIDAKLAETCGVSVDELRPWHYHDPFFQEAPAVFGTKLDDVFKDADILRVCREFYADIGLPIDDVMSRSDLYERPGKSPHAFCTDIDREGDVRVLANIVPNEAWMGTMLHELGHAVYSSKNIPPSVPYVLRSDAHILCTEGVAMMFERFSKSGDWLKEMGVDVPDVAAYNAAGARARRDQLLIFSRWCEVMLRFEKGLYENPEQDLNELWWNLVEEYQGLRRPEGRDMPDYAAKIHIVSAPAYYHNYMLGQLFACQVHRTIAREVLQSDDAPNAYYTKNPAVGKFMIDRVFAPGRSLPWNDLTKHATGEPLSARAFAAEFGSEGK